MSPVPTRPDRSPITAAPREWRWWSWINVLGLALLIGIYGLSRSGPLAGLVLSIGGLVQITFGAMLVTDRQGFAERLSEYYAHRPLARVLILNRSVVANRVQGAVAIVFGAAIAVVGSLLVLGVDVSAR